MDTTDDLHEVATECTACEGTGKDDDEGCPQCAGSGSGMHGDPTTSRCPACKGRGTVLPAACEECNGDGYITTEVTAAERQRMIEAGLIVNPQNYSTYDPEDSPSC